MRAIKSLFYLFLVISLGSMPAAGRGEDMAQPIKIDLPLGTVTVDPKGLAVSFKPANKADTTPEAVHLVAAADQTFLTPMSVTMANGVYKINYPESEVEVQGSENAVRFTIFPQKDTLINWPDIPEDPKLQTYLIPEGEGLFVPVRDKKIRNILTDKTLDHTNMMPFVGFMYDGFSMTAILHTPYRSTLMMKSLGDGLGFQYDFRLRDKQPFYEISLTMAKPDLLEPSRIFKSFLKKEKQYVTLEEKIRLNPEVAKLAGAIHIYMWGDGRTIKALQELKDLGVSRAWIGYEEKPPKASSDPQSITEYVNKEFIDFGKKAGFLIGAYDSYHTMEPSEKAGSYNTDFGKEFYPKGCVRSQNGKIVPGFAGRGCAVSMTALDQSDNILVKNRIAKFKADGVNSYFLDCHGMLEAYDDYTPAHPQTILEDIAIRKKQLSFLSTQGVVLGSESATAYTIQYLAFSHGNFSTLYHLHYPLTKNKKLYGSWWPAKRPKIFFNSFRADESYSIRYSPEYRVPLFQAVFHESIVTTDRWEIPLIKFTNLYQDRFLLEFLYGVPSMWDLDLKAIGKYHTILEQLGKEFTSLHSKIMTKALERFEYLTGDRLVQKTVYGDNEVTIIGNFKAEAYMDIPAKSLKVIFHDTDNSEIITPGALPAN